MNDTLMTRFVIAHHFDVSERTIERWEKQGMPVIVIGKIHRYDYSKVMEWVGLLQTVKGITK